MNRFRIVALFVLVTVVACLCGLRGARMQSSTLRRITNTSEEGLNLNPSISGDGRIIAFESTEDVAAAGGADHFRAIRANITGDPATFLQIAGSRLVAPAISQDGTRIAFASRDDLLGTNSDGNSEIFLFDGATLTQVTNTSPGSLANRISNGNFQPSISDDGRFIAFSSNRDLAGQNSDGNLEIFVYDSNANSFAQLTNSTGIVGATDAKISGDGNTIAFIRDNGITASPARDLLKQPRSSGPATTLMSSVPSLAMTYGRAISDDGARVVYAAETATNTTQVFLCDGRSGGTIRQITALGARVTEVPLNPTISGDGSRIAFAARRPVSGAGSNSDGGVELYVYDLPTSTFAKITNAPSSATAEVVSSLNDDGSIVAFNFPRVLSGAVTNSGTDNNSEIYAIAPPVRPANGNLTAILNDASLGHEPSATKAIAPNSIAAAQGTNLASATTQAQRLAEGTFPTNVGGTRVTVNGRAAQIFFVSPAQINFQVPPQTEIGTAEVIVTSPENFPSRGTIQTLRAAPGIFTKTGDGIGEGLILNSDTLQEGPFDPTNGNLRLTIFTTGARNASATTVSIGGRVVNPEGVLPSSTMPGLEEVHVRVPADLRGAGTVNLIVNSDGRDSNPVAVNLLGDPGRAIFFNEVLSDPPNGIAGDANNDGVRDGADDEFVEFVNGSAAEAIGMSGWTVKTRANGSTTETTRFTFPAGTSLPPGTAAVIFGGGNFNPANSIFGCAQLFKATSSAGLSLTNTGLTILLRDTAGNLIAQFAYGGSTGIDGNNSQSITRSPDITGGFVLHTNANPARRFSAGLKVDGTPFGACAGRLATVSIAPPTNSVNRGESAQFTAQALDQFGRPMKGFTINFSSDNTTVATIESTATDVSTGAVTAAVGTHNGGVAHITATAADGTVTANSTPATLNVSGPLFIPNKLSVSDVTTNEGNSGPTTFAFTVSLSQPAPTGGVTFDIGTQDGTATVANVDYVARALTNQVIPAGAQSYSFDVTVNGDTAIEPNENFFVNISNVNGAVIGKGQGTGTIVNDDSPSLSISDVSANEGNSGTTKFTFTVTTPVPAVAGGITFDIATADGTATSASGDYVARALSGQIIPAGQSSYTFDVMVNGDTLAESNETFLVNITNVSDAALNDSQAQGTIQNDDTANLVISQVYSGGGLSSATFTNDFIELYNRGTATIDLSVTPYSAQFLSTTGSTWVKTDLTSGIIAPGRYFLIREASGGATGSSLPAGDAAGTINLTSTTDGKVALVDGTILLAGSCPGDDGTQPFNPVNVADFVGYGGTATTANHCYEGTGPASFTLGNNTIAAYRKAGGCVDTNDNPNDIFTAQPNPRNSAAPIGDCKPELTINDVTVTEGNTGTVNATFTVSLSATSAQTVRVDLATADGTANAPADYQANTGTLTFNPGDLTKTITVLVNGDTMDEPSETFFINLTNAVNGVILDSQGQGTINDNDAAPTLSISDVAVAEGDSGTTNATFNVMLSAPSGFTVTVNYATADNTANAGSDYQTASGTVTFNPGETSKPITVLVNGDTAFEQNESFFVNLSSPVNAAIADGRGIGTINNDDPLPPTPNFFVNDVDISEGDSGTKTANFNVTLNPAASQQVTVQYATANGTANAGSDYESTSGTLTFAAGETSKTVSVTINGDTLVEPDETFLVNLSNPSAGTTLGDPQGAGTIQNDDLASLVISQVYPGGGLTGATYTNDFIELYNRGTTTIDFSVTPYSVQFLSTSGSTWAKTDLTTGTIIPGHYFLIKETGGAVGGALPTADANGTINLTSTTAGKVALASNTTLLTATCPGDDGSQPFNPAGASIVDFVGYLGANATANHCYEGSGPAAFTSGSNTTADFRKAGGCLDTNDNASDFFVGQPNPRNSASPSGDCKPEVVINDVTVTEVNTGTVNATFTVTLTAPSAQTVTVDFATADGTASAPADYQSNNGTLTFAPGETTKTLTVLVNGDTLDEASETFFVNLTNPSNASIVDARGLGTITDNDPAPSISINDVSVAEGNSGTTNLNFTVSLSTASGQVVNVKYATADNTATAPSDYQSASGAVTFNPGETAKQVTLLINGDPDFEQNETFFVNLSGATNASISDNQGIGTINNDDAAPPTPTFFIDDVSVGEGNSGPSTLNFTVTLSTASNQQTTVDYATANGTATSGSDFQTASGTLTFGPGETSKQISVTINGDTLVEPDETFSVNLTNATGGAGIGDNQGLGAITNDDVAQVVISQIYGGGNNSGATYKNDYIELFNRGTTTVDLAGWSVQQASATGASWSVTPLCPSGSCLMTPSRYFLVKEAPTSPTIGAELPTPDATGTINLATGSGKIALVSNAAGLSGSGCPFGPSIIDFAGYGTTDCSENSTPAPAHSNTTSDFRKGGGCTDTNDNAADFFTSTPFPRNSTSTNNCAGGTTPNLTINDVTVTEGNSGTTTATFTVSLSSPAQGTDVTFDIATANGTATTANSDYLAKTSTNQIIPAGQTTYTFTVTVNGDTSVEPDETFFVNVTNVVGATLVDGQGQGTIQNDDLPALSINDVSAFEGNAGTTTFSFTVSLSAPAPATVTFDVATADGTATTGDNDYAVKTLTSQTIVAGLQSYQFDVTVNGDTTIEPNETFFVNLTNVSGATIGDGQGTGTIQNDDRPKLTINDVSANEGDSGTSTFTFTVSLSQPAAAGGVTFDIATADGTAAGSDYVSRTLTNQSIAAGQSSYRFDVTVDGDQLVEPNETLFVNVTNVSGATVLDAQGQGTIQNDDVANLKISQVYGGGNNSGATYQNDFVEIFNAGSTNVDFSVTPYSIQYAGVGSNFGSNKTNLTNGSLAPGKYFLVQEAGGATNGVPLPAPDATGSINLAGTTGKVALVFGTAFLSSASCPGDDASAPFNPLDGAIADFVGYGSLPATSGHCYEGAGPASAPGNTTSDYRKAGGCTDTNDNAADFFTQAPFPRNSSSAANDCSSASAPNLSINDVTVVEGNSGTTTATFTVGLSAPAPGADVTFDIATQDNSATTANGDYVTRSLTNQIIPAGQTSYTFSVTVNGDLNVEPDENFFVNVTNVSGANVADGQGIGTIQHDDLPTLSIDDVAAAEGDSGTKSFTFHVTLSDPAPATVTFDIATADVTAQDHNPASEDNDYQARTIVGQTIAQGASSFDLAVTVNGDTTNESNETFFVNVTNLNGVTLADGQGQGTIQNDDAPPNLSITDVTQAEGSAGTSTFNFTVSLSAPARDGGVSFTINTADGTSNPAIAGSDYVAIVNGSGSIPEGSSSTTAAVTVNGDTVFEPSETFFVNLSNVTGANVTDSQGLGTITNDDAQPTLAIADASITEGNSGTSSMTFTVTMTGSSQSSVTVNYATSDSSATVADNDYDAASGLLTFTPGDATKTFNVTIHGDTNAEGDEMFLVDLSTPSSATISDSQAFGTIFLDDPFSIAAVNTAYTENFDGLAQIGNSSTTPTAWTRAESNSAANTIYTANNGSSTTGDTYSYGTNGSSDRALGGLRTGTLVPTIGAYFKNDTGSAINSLQIAYTGEEWRLGNAGRTDRLDFQYSTNATSLTTGTWTDDDALDFTTPNITTAGSKDGNNAANRTAITHTITGLSIAAGATFWIRWNDLDATGADDGLAVDDFSITAAIDTPALTIDDLSQSEGASGTTTFNFNVHLSSPAPPGGVSFTVNTANGTTNPANAGSDYVAIVNGSGSIPQNSSSTTVSVTVNGDMIVEPDETFFVNLSSVTGATISDGQALGTIQNDDSAPASADLSLTKSVDQSTPNIGENVKFTIKLSNAGPDSATSVQVKDLLPSGLQFVSSTVTQGSYANGTGIWTVGVVAVGTNAATLTITATVTSTGAKINKAEVSASATSDPDSLPNDGSVTDDDFASVAVTGAANLLINEVHTQAQTSPPADANDFIELFNKGSHAIDINGMVFSFRAGSSSPATFTVSSATIVPAGGYLIIVNGATAYGVTADINASSSGFNHTATSGGVKIVLNGVQLDGLAYQAPGNTVSAIFAAFGEGTVFSSPTASGQQDYVRSPNGADSNDNATDWRRSGANSTTVTPKGLNPTITP